MRRWGKEEGVWVNGGRRGEGDIQHDGSIQINVCGFIGIFRIW